MFSLDVMFWLLAVSSIAGAIAVVSMDDVFWSALCLVVTFLSIAGLFVLLNAEFLAAVQVLIYVWAITILVIFAIMITRNFQEGSTSNGFQIISKITIGLLLICMTFALTSTDWNQWSDYDLRVTPGESTVGLSATEEGIRNVFSDTTPILANLLLKDFVLPFEAASILLLAAIIGALVMVQERNR